MGDRLLFLDVDGVLNDPNWYTNLLDLKEVDQVVPRDWFQRHVKPELVARLNRLVLDCQAKIVVSSHWRGSKLDVTRPRFRAMGVTGRIIGQTPRLEFRVVNSDLVVTNTRGSEIHQWLCLHKLPSSFAILDDGNDMAPHMDRLVHVNGNIGLTDADCAKARELLLRPWTEDE